MPEVTANPRKRDLIAGYCSSDPAHRKELLCAAGLIGEVQCDRVGALARCPKPDRHGVAGRDHASWEPIDVAVRIVAQRSEFDAGRRPRTRPDPWGRISGRGRTGHPRDNGDHYGQGSFHAARPTVVALYIMAGGLP